MDKARETMRFDRIRSMLPEQLDELPSPVEFRCTVGRGRKAKEVRIRKRWVGIGWVDEGEADGTEPLLITE